MDIIKKYILLIIISMGLCNSEVNSLYDKGINSYKNEKYFEAIIYFNKIIDLNYESEEFYYNLGNAHYLDNNIPLAIWSYENCLKLNPLNDDVKFNLKLSNLNVKDRIAIPDPPLLLNIFRLMKSTLLPSEWIMLWTLLFFIVSIFFLIRTIYFIIFLKYFELFFCILILTLLLPGSFSIYDSYTISQGIILSSKISVFSAPSNSSTELFNIHEGLKVDIKETNHDWVKIKLIDGKEGWIKSNQILDI